MKTARELELERLYDASGENLDSRRAAHACSFALAGPTPRMLAG